MNQGNNGLNDADIFNRQKLSTQSMYIIWENELIIPAINSFYDSPEGANLIQQNAPEPEVVAGIRSRMESLFSTIQPTRDLLQGLVIYSGRTLEKITFDACDTCFQTNCLIKKTAYSVSQIIPDILIYRREPDESNHVVIEFKKAENDSAEERDHDVAKLTYLTCPQSRYQYKYGYFIDLYADGYEITQYKNAMPKTKIEYRQRGSLFARVSQASAAKETMADEMDTVDTATSPRL